MRFLGEIVRLQIQHSGLKIGPRPLRRYHPAPIQQAPALIVGEGGAVTWSEDEGLLLDVHHRDHPAGKNDDGIHGLSVLFTAHYHAMQARFGPHVRDGIAGESILIQTIRIVGEEELRAGLVIVTASGEQVRLHITKVAEPCVEFTRYTLGRPADAPADDVMKEALIYLRDGMRGFYAGCHGGPQTIRIGDRVYLTG